MIWILSGFVPGFFQAGIVSLIASWIANTYLGKDGRLVGVSVGIGMMFSRGGRLSLQDPAEMQELGFVIGATVATLLLWLRWYKWSARSSEKPDV